MGLPNRTTPLQQHIHHLRERYWLASDGHLYDREKGTRKAVYEGARSTTFYTFTRSKEVIRISSNSLRWALGTGQLPNGDRVEVVRHGLACGSKTLRFADLPEPPTNAALPFGSPSPSDCRPPANAERRIHRLMHSYDQVVMELAKLGVDPVRRVRTTTRTITEEVPL